MTHGAEGECHVGRRWPTALAVPLLLAGCASEEPPGAPPSAASIVVDSFPAADAGLEPPPEGATNALLDGSTTPARLTLTSWGSSGCVPVPQSVQWTAPSTVEVTTAPSTSTLCAASYEPISQVVELPDEHTVGEITTVEVDGEQVRLTREGQR